MFRPARKEARVSQAASSRDLEGKTFLETGNGGLVRLYILNPHLSDERTGAVRVYCKCLFVETRFLITPEQNSVVFEESSKQQALSDVPSTRFEWV